MTKASKKNVILDRITYICYLIWFKKNEVQTLIDSGSEINTMILAYALKLSFKVRRTNVKAQKIDNSTLETFGMVLTNFQIEDKLKKARFF